MQTPFAFLTQSLGVQPLPVPGVVVVLATQEVPFQYAVLPQPPTGGLGAVVVGAQKVPFQAVFGPHPPTGILGAVVVVVVGAQKVPFQAVFGPHPPTGAVGVVVVVTVGFGPPLFSQEDWFVPSLQRTA